MLLQADAVPPSLSTGPRASLDGGVQTRLDSPWPSTGSTQGFGREQDTGNAASLRARARRLEIVNWLASGVLDRAVENVIGTTFRVEPMTGDKQFDGRARRWWRRWWNSSACDLRGMFTGGALLRQAYRAKLRDGDVLIVLATVEGQINGRTIRIPKLQIIEGERIKNPTQAVDGRLPGGNQITEGVEMDDNGRPIAYWVEWADRNGVHHYERVESRDAIFLHRTTRSSFVRGESAFRGGFLLFEQIMGYLDSVIVAARVGASQAIIAKKKNPAADLRALQVLNPSGVSVASQQRVMPIQPGAINFVGIDEDLVAFNPAQPQQQFPDALDAFCRILGTKFGLTLEQVLLYFSKVTFHAGRAARFQA